MNFIRLMAAALSRDAQSRPSLRLKITNATRQSVLAERADVADHGTARNKGLLGRDHLQDGGGLWIVPCEAVHTFGMRFAIDLVYIDRDKIVKKVRSSVTPWRLSGCFSAHSIIELPSGVVLASQTRPGDRLVFSSAETPAED